MMGLRVGISTQTPLLRLDGVADPASPAASQGPATGVRNLAARLRRNVRRDVDRLLRRPFAPPGASGPPESGRLADFDITPGGVSRMVLHSVQAWRRRGWIREAHWFSLQPGGPARLRLEGSSIDLHHLRLPADQLHAYARTKEKLWADIHGLDAPRFDTEDFRFYARYNGLVSDAILEQVPDLDVAYVHDFQLLQVGAIVGLAAPCVLRWHVPFDPARIPRYTRSFLLRMMEAYDGIIVSTRRDLEGLTNAGYHGRVRQIYPHSDPQGWDPPTNAATQLFEDRFAIKPDHPVILCVARMDPMKRQDLAIQALRSLGAAHPAARLVLVGNGSFSGNRKTGLGLSKSTRWRDHLQGLARELGVADRVTFTGWLPDDLVSAAYQRADVLVLPSDIEGFGLTPFEAWGYGKPCVISTGCGAAEVVQEGVNGRMFPSGDPQALARCLKDILDDGEGAQRMGAAGRIALRSHGPDRAARQESAFLEEAMERYGRAS
jgi:glycosyltransferase involved in cell wall biosynthesis